MIEAAKLIVRPGLRAVFFMAALLLAFARITKQPITARSQPAG